MYTAKTSFLVYVVHYLASIYTQDFYLNSEIVQTVVLDTQHNMEHNIITVDNYSVSGMAKDIRSCLCLLT